MFFSFQFFQFHSSVLQLAMENCTGIALEQTSDSLHRLIFFVSSTTIVVGIAANFFIVISFCKVELLRSVTNYFIVNLAIADIFLLISLAIWISCESISLTRTQARLAKNILISIDVFCSSASLTSLACVSVDRYLAITVPLRYQSITTHSRALVAVFTVWAFSIITFITSYSRDVVRLVVYNKIYISCLFALTFTIPILVTTGSYYRIFRAVWHQLHHLPKQTNPRRRARFIMKEFRVAVNILVTIVPVYFLWGSFWVATLQEAITESTNHAPVVDWLLGSAPHFAAAVNPVIYISMTRDFRLLFLRLLSCKKRNEDLSMVAECRQRTISLRSCSTQHSIPLVAVNSDETARSLISEDSKSSNGQLLSTDSSCVTSSPVEEKACFPSSV